MTLQDDVPSFSDDENYVDNAKDEDLIPHLLQSKPREIDGISAIVVVDNIPKVDKNRFEKLRNILMKLFQKYGTVRNCHFPIEPESHTTKGYVFVEFESHNQALTTVKELNKHSLDKHHILIVNLLCDIDKYSQVPDEWEPPEPQKFTPFPDLYDWLKDVHCIDQFCIMYNGGEITAIYWNTQNEPLLVEERHGWTETITKWSPKGTFLATFHAKGIALWGGNEFKQIQKFAHNNVQLIDFSPCERYILTYFAPLTDNVSRSDDSQDIIIWDMRTGKKKRGFQCANAAVWPVFKWSHDGSYFARITDDLLQVYETPSFGLVEKKSMKIKGITDFSWSPTDNIISYWTPEEENTPARVVLMEIPSKIHLCTKNLFTVADCKMYWQKSGDYLCVKVDRYKGRKIEGKDIKYTGMYHNLNVFRIREKQVPIDTVEVKDTIRAFEWEPNGTKFIFIHGEVSRSSVSFYNVKKSGQVELLKVMEKKTVNMIFWSPQGQFVVLAGLRQMNGTLEFIDTADLTVMNQGEHVLATDIEWDPTGRYVTTCVSYWINKTENAYWIWNFQGKILLKVSLNKFCQFFWRPRPPCLLDTKKLKDLRKNMKKYNAKFNMEDKVRETKATKEQIDKRKAAMAEWEDFCDCINSRFKSQEALRKKLRKNIDNIENEEEYEYETVEFLLNVEEIIEE